MQNIGKLKVHTDSDKIKLAKKMANDISLFLEKKKKQRKNVLFLVSGGSAFLPLDYIKQDVLGEYLTVCVLDERYDKTNKNNNFSQLKKTSFFKKAKSKKVSFFDTSVKSKQSQKELAFYFENEIKNWYRKNKNKIMIATAGIGPDGHTSGIMPFSESKKKFNELFCAKNWVVAYDASSKNKHKKRISTTCTFLKKLNHVFVFVFGKEKREAFANFKENGNINDVPARILKKIKGDIYLDKSLY